MNTLAIDLETGEPGAGYAEYTPSRQARAEARDKMEQEMEDVMKTLREREKRTVLRKLEAGEVTFDKSRRVFIYKDTDEEYKLD